MSRMKWLAYAAGWLVVLGISSSLAEDGAGEEVSRPPAREVVDRRATGPVRDFEDRAGPAVKRAIEARLQAFEDAWNAHDPVRLAAFYSADATLLATSGEIANGRQQIEEQLRAAHAGEVAETTVSLTLDAVRQLSPTLVLADAVLRLGGLVEPDDTIQPNSDFRLTLVMKKDGRQWWIQAQRTYAAPPASLGVGGSGGPPVSSPPVDPRDSSPYNEGEDWIDAPSIPMPPERPMER